MESLLVIDPHFEHLHALDEFARKNRLRYRLVESGKDALNLLKENQYDFILTEMTLPDIEGLTLVRLIKEDFPSSELIIHTHMKNLDKATSALKLGVTDYFLKPMDDATWMESLEKVFLFSKKIKSGEPLFHEVIAVSPAMKKVLKEALLAAKSNANIFIHGESGTGKEVVAKYIHDQSLRSEKPFIKVNCAAIPDTLIEAEFFGHEKGAFTGAINNRMGRFELADKGTLLLDEISEVPLTLQPKLLRVIQEQEFERIGSMRSKKVDVRLISTANRNMKKAIETSVFREDLYFRLNVIPIYLPPLRERREDIIPLTLYFLKKFSKENHKPVKSLSPEAEKKLLQYDWPGNIRELGNIVERAVIMVSENTIDGSDLPLTTPEATKLKELIEFVSLSQMEKTYIQDVLKHCGDNKTEAAKILGISVRTLRNKIKEPELPISLDIA